jgi:hypothetical protein
MVGSGDMTPGVPGSIANNDILVVFVHTRDNVDSTMPGDWTALVSGNGNATNRIEAYWKRTSGSESAPTVTHTAGDSSIAVMHAYRGCLSSGSPWDTLGTVQSNAGSPISTTAITTGTNGDIILHVFGSQDNNAWGTYTGIPTSIGSTHANSTGTDNSLGITYGQQASSGSTGTAGATQSTLGPDAGASVLVSMKQDSVSATVNLAGLSTTVSGGSLSVAVAVDGTATLSGLSTNASGGSLSVSGDGTLSLSGSSMTVSGGNLSVSGGPVNGDVTLAGIQATVSGGSLTVTANAVIALAGTGLTVSGGSLSVSDGSAPPAGQNTLQGGGLGDQNTPMGGMW